MDKIEFDKILNNKDLYETNNQLIKRFYHKYRSYCLGLGYDFEDLRQDVWIDIWDKTLKKYAYKDDKHLKSLITKGIKWALYRFRVRTLKLSDEEVDRNWENQKHLSEHNEVLNPKSKINLNEVLYPTSTRDCHRELNIKFILESFNEFLNERERFIMYERFFKNKKWKEIAKELEVSLTYTIMLYDKILAKIKKNYKKEE